MEKRILAVLLAALFLQCAFARRATAQSGNCSPRWFTCGYYSLLNMSCEPTPPPDAFNCQGVPFAFEMLCQLPPFCPPPDVGGDGPGPSCSSNGGSCTAGKPVNLSNGDTYMIETDIRLAGLGGGLSLVRTWNSLWPGIATAYQIGMFGPNWRSAYEERIFLTLAKDGNSWFYYIRYGRSDGSVWTFVYNNGGEESVAPANASATLLEGDTYWTLYLKDGETRLFDNNSGKLIAIIDRNGNTTRLSYDSLGRLVTVTDPVSRHLYFNYGSGSYLVASVTSDFGVSASYSYDGQGRLSQVTEPDGSTLSYQYDSNSFITAVLDSNGKVLEAHTYDSSGRALTSSLANGVEAFTLSY